MIALANTTHIPAKQQTNIFSQTIATAKHANQSFSTFKRQLRSECPCRGGAFCHGKGDMIALTATPPKTALAVFGVRVGTVGDYKGESPLERFRSEPVPWDGSVTLWRAKGTATALKYNKYCYIRNDIASKSYKHTKAFRKLTFKN